MKVSTVIILVNYNGYDDTAACLETIGNSNGDLPFVILIDNASTEKGNLDELNDIYSNLKIIRNSENIGFGRANNVGITWAQQNLDFEYLLLLNNDTLIEPDSLFYLRKAFTVDPEVGITTSKTMYEGDRNLVWYGGGEINYKRGWPKIVEFQKEASKEGANKARYVDFVSGCVMMFTKESIKKIKGFDKDIFMYCEDLELCMRASKIGYKLYYEPKSIIFHKVQGGNTNIRNKGIQPGNKNLAFLFYHMKSNQYLTMQKHLMKIDFVIFNFIFFSEMIYTNLKMLTAGRFDVLQISIRTIKRILFNTKNSISFVK